jgi:hypothetical protein
MKYFHRGALNLSRLNYGLIVLLTKIIDVVQIKQQTYLFVEYNI